MMRFSLLIFCVALALAFGLIASGAPRWAADAAIALALVAAVPTCFAALRGVADLFRR